VTQTLPVAELGHYALVLALALMLIQSAVPLVGIRWGDERLVAVGRSTAMIAFGCVGIAFAALTATPTCNLEPVVE
jgi:cytochrome c-type biogenesis protein CcmF